MKTRQMTDLAEAIGDALLQHHKEFCSNLDTPPETAKEMMAEQVTIPYVVLLRKAKVADFVNPVNVGKYLDEVAAWSKENRFPPINALAVNGETGIPGAGFDAAEGCANWPEQVQKCIAYKNYPPTIAATL